MWSTKDLIFLEDLGNPGRADNVETSKHDCHLREVGHGPNSYHQTCASKVVWGIHQTTTYHYKPIHRAVVNGLLLKDAWPFELQRFNEKHSQWRVQESWFLQNTVKALNKITSIGRSCLLLAVHFSCFVHDSSIHDKRLKDVYTCQKVELVLFNWKT